MPGADPPRRPGGLLPRQLDLRDSSAWSHQLLDAGVRFLQGGSAANGKRASEPRVRWTVQHEEDHLDKGQVHDSQEHKDTCGSAFLRIY
ncbi:uncharacterized protein [Triticum aestivum]|uniref:uncharacterized protein isoform X3 n=1 Tax=Triticum aestivum TaxID=4565 RepID=UPI001D019AA2|nr:uncharacterized protein LOC123086072 isoform X3 [Triticum aestivum]